MKPEVCLVLEREEGNKTITVGGVGGQTDTGGGKGLKVWYRRGEKEDSLIQKLEGNVSFTYKVKTSQVPTREGRPVCW